MYIDLPTWSEVRSLLEVTGRECVSIYMPATPRPDDADAERIGFKNLAADAVAQLGASGADGRVVSAFAEAFAELDDDPGFWRYQARSLVVLATVDEVRTYRLANRLEPAAVVADRFFVKPLLRALTFPNAGFVLALAQGSVRLFELGGGDEGAIEIDVADLPDDIDSFVETVPGAAGSSASGVLSPEGQASRLRKYARQVDRTVRGAVRGHDLPVVLAATEPLASVFRAVTTLSTLADEQIDGNPDRMSPTELAAAARPVLDAVYAAEVRELHERFSERTGQRRTATDLAEIARAATAGAVDVLIVDIDRVVPGQVGDDGQVSFTDGPGSFDIVDEVARRTLDASGRVVAVRSDEVPGGQEAAAILRYA